MTDLSHLFRNAQRNQSSNEVPSTKKINKEINTMGYDWFASTKPSTARKPLKKTASLAGVATNANELALEEAATAEAERHAVPLKKGDAIDWRNVNGKNYITRAWNQGSCNACVSFATVGVIEANLRIQTNNPNLEVALSEAHLNFCRRNAGCRLGWGFSSGLKWAMEKGIPDDDCHPWSSRSTCAQRCSDWAKRAVRIKNYGIHRTLEERKAAVERGPVIGGIYLFSDFASYSGGIYRKTPSAKPLGMHAIVVIGYDDREGCWIIKNSFGRKWGDDGCGKIAYNEPDVRLDNAFPFYSAGEIIVPKDFYQKKKTGSRKNYRTNLTSIFGSTF
jgi:hypothetical protein